MTDKQDSLEGIRKQIGDILASAIVVDDNGKVVSRTDQILNLTVSSGGVCPECQGEKWIWVNHCSEGYLQDDCLFCNGTGQKPIVTKELREIINEYNM